MQKLTKQHNQAFVSMYRCLSREFTTVECIKRVSSELFCNHKSIHDEAVSNVRKNLQYFNMGIFVHILSSRTLWKVID